MHAPAMRRKFLHDSVASEKESFTEYGAAGAIFN